MSHEKTITVGFEQGGVTKYYNIPTVHKGKTMGNQEAIKHHKASGKPLGKGFVTIKKAVDAAKKRSQE